MIRRYALAILSFALLAAAQAQDLSFSPYSRYAIGDIFDATTTRNAAMGGIGVASDNYFSINRTNPASYGDLFYTTMDVSAFGQLDRIRSADSKASPFHAGIHDAAFAFPANKGPAIVFGFSPYSSVGYQIVSTRQIELEPDSMYLEEGRYGGSGGLSQAFLGVGGRVWNKRLRLGAELQYLFGNTQYTWNVNVYRQLSDTVVLRTGFQPVSVVRDVFLGGFNGQVGFIYEDTVNKAKNILWRFGGTADLSLGLNGDRFTTFSNSLVIDTLGTREVGSIVLPSKYGVGLMVNRPGYWSLGADFTYQDWSQFSYFGDSLALGREMRVGVGGEWTPNPESGKFFRRVNYRAGAYWRQTYIQFDDTPVPDFGVSLGIGIPAGAKGNSRFNPGRITSRINLSAELGRRGAVNDALPLEELYARFRLGFTINDRWFIRRVVD
ncbi:MAG: membrane protein [Bacteroidia bacterium]